MTTARQPARPDEARPTDETLRHDLALANHVLVAQGIVDAFGHPSVRRADGPGFLISRNLAPASVTDDDVQVVDLDGTPQDDRRPYLERFIHAAVYRARPDVGAVVHHHSPALLPFAVTGRPLVPVWHMAAFLGAGAPVWEIRDAAGLDTDLVVGSNELGDSLAETLGEAGVVLMRGHGATVVGATLAEAVHRCVYLEHNARILTAALSLDPDPVALTPGEARAATRTTSGQADRAWSLWTAQAEQDRR